MRIMIIATLMLQAACTTTGVHTDLSSVCGTKLGVAKVASTPMVVDNVLGFSVVDVSWPNFLFYENVNKTGRIMVIDAVGHITKVKGTEIRIDISKDKNGSALLLWYRISQQKVIERGISLFDGKSFVAVCRENP